MFIKELVKPFHTKFAYGQLKKHTLHPVDDILGIIFKIGCGTVNHPILYVNCRYTINGSMQFINECLFVDNLC